MPGTIEGGRKAARTNKIRYGEDTYRIRGAAGGKISRGGGFAADHDLARRAGRKGGQVSRRRKAEDAELIKQSEINSQKIL